MHPLSDCMPSSYYWNIGNYFRTLMICNNHPVSQMLAMANFGCHLAQAELKKNDNARLWSPIQ